MAKKFKDYYDTECAGLIAGKIAEVSPDFPASGFVRQLSRELEGKEFMARQDAFAEALERCMPGSYSENLQLLHRILGPELQTAEGMFTHGYWLWPIGRYVERNGVKDVQSSVAFCHELTKRFTGEFAMRPLLDAEPEATLQTVLAWSTDPNVHVRRLASECLRIRLPWAKKSLIALQHFDMYRAVLGNLRHDPEKFVQKSVGNNLNDLMKESPPHAREIIAAWEKDAPSKATEWIIRHGLRSLRKRD
ncbi:MAG: DNA alkylation repair protein [Balneolaceae bacterium]|nr:MAG: DNA alkylation repair protein [Balneolaceae bacterium]